MKQQLTYTCIYIYIERESFYIHIIYIYTRDANTHNHSIHIIIYTDNHSLVAYQAQTKYEHLYRHAWKTCSEDGLGRLAWGNCSACLEDLRFEGSLGRLAWKTCLEDLLLAMGPNSMHTYFSAPAISQCKLTHYLSPLSNQKARLREAFIL